MFSAHTRSCKIKWAYQRRHALQTWCGMKHPAELWDHPVVDVDNEKGTRYSKWYEFLPLNNEPIDSPLVYRHWTANRLEVHRLQWALAHALCPCTLLCVPSWIEIDWPTWLTRFRKSTRIPISYTDVEHEWPKDSGHQTDRFSDLALRPRSRSEPNLVYQQQK